MWDLLVDIYPYEQGEGASPLRFFCFFFFLDDKSLVMVSCYGYEILRLTKPFLSENFFQQ